MLLHGAMEVLERGAAGRAAVRGIHGERHDVVHVLFRELREPFFCEGMPVAHAGHGRGGDAALGQRVADGVRLFRGDSVQRGLSANQAVTFRAGPGPLLHDDPREPRAHQRAEGHVQDEGITEDVEQIGGHVFEGIRSAHVEEYHTQLRFRHGLNRSGESGALGGAFASVEVVVEDEREVSEEVSSQRGGLHRGGAVLHESLGSQWFQPGQFEIEIAVEADGEAFLDRLLPHDAVAEEIHDDGSTNVIVGVKGDVALHGQIAAIEAFVIRRIVLFILIIIAGHVADARRAKGENVRIGVRCIAHEVPAEPLGAPGGREFVLGPGKVVHADHGVSRVLQALDRHQVEVELEVGFRQFGGHDLFLVLAQRWQEGEAVDRNAVRGEARHFRERVRRLAEVLAGQAVHEVEVQASDAVRAYKAAELGSSFIGLIAADLALDFGVEVLHADAEAVESMPEEEVQLLVIARHGVGFDGQFRIVFDVKRLAHEIEHGAELILLQRAGRAAAPVDLRDAAPLRQERAHEPDFPEQRVHVFGGLCGALELGRVAAAIVANDRAEFEPD